VAEADRKRLQLVGIYENVLDLTRFNKITVEFAKVTGTYLDRLV
jgi:hypothetical protein